MSVKLLVITFIIVKRLVQVHMV